MIGLGALTACGGGDEPAADPTSQSPEAEETTTEEETATETESPEAEETTSEESTDAAAPSGEIPAPVAVGETITDDVLGDVITVNQVITGFPSVEWSNIAEDGGEFVVVEVQVEAGDQFSGGVQGGFKLLSGGQTAGSATSILNNDLVNAGMAPFEGVSSGESGSGWVAFQVNTASAPYELTYTRMAASVIGSDETIPEQVWTIPLP
ncbi:transcriptional regulator [Serinibacter arcticus]|uniref:Transcriptional regulator n=1 Tax=Serinibacter arcticus TaxID=1655435 RepID=A0A2U1ZVI1_9MICO|nr:transcriptional regulator [Serinibacter arcticus]